MNVTFPINKLLERGLTADDYSIALLLKEGKYGLLKDYIKICGMKFYESLKRLKELGYVEYSTIGDIIPIKEAKVTEEFVDITLNGDNFEEFYDLYPVKTTRPDGKVDYLRRDKAKCKTKYKRITKNNLMIHDFIMDCLRFDIENRQSRDNMAYMKQMKNWLDGEEWKIIDEYRLQLAEKKEQASRKHTNTYGADLL